jgi:hypothetical protein
MAITARRRALQTAVVWAPRFTFSFALLLHVIRLNACPAKSGEVCMHTSWHRALLIMRDV